MFVFPAVPYLESLRLGKNELVQALGLSFSVSTLALGAHLLSDGTATLAAASAGAWLLPLLVALLGMSVGRKLRAFTSDRLFRRLFFGGLAALGAHLMVKNLVA